jgi:metal-sulfur cluster biosynthetic enzyme
MVTPETVREALHRVVDPELGMDVVDLGLVYGIEVIGTTVFVTMTLTTPLCPMNEFITSTSCDVVRALPGVTDVRVDVVWTPPWGPEMVSREGRKKLGW